VARDKLHILPPPISFSLLPGLLCLIPRPQSQNPLPLLLAISLLLISLFESSSPPHDASIIITIRAVHLSHEQRNEQGSVPDSSSSTIAVMPFLSPHLLSIIITSHRYKMLIAINLSKEKKGDNRRGGERRLWRVLMEVGEAEQGSRTEIRGFSSGFI